ncbi:hypothetical protein THAOC_19222, partial [Thalassiosira oceanica]
MPFVLFCEIKSPPETGLTGLDWTASSLVAAGGGVGGSVAVVLDDAERMLTLTVLLLQLMQEVDGLVEESG